MLHQECCAISSGKGSDPWNMLVRQKTWNPPVTYQTKRVLLYYIQFINKCHAWLALVELLGEMQFPPSYVPYHPFWWLLCSFIFEGDISRPNGRDTSVTVWFTHFLFVCTVCQSHGSTMTEYVAEMSLTLGYFIERGFILENQQKIQYSTSFGDHKVLYIFCYRNRLQLVLSFPISLLYDFHCALFFPHL